jgi:hypothetical protein
MFTFVIKKNIYINIHDEVHVQYLNRIKHSILVQVHVNTLV